MVYFFALFFRVKKYTISSTGRELVEVKKDQPSLVGKQRTPMLDFIHRIYVVTCVTNLDPLEKGHDLDLDKESKAAMHALKPLLLNALPGMKASKVVIGEGIRHFNAAAALCTIVPEDLLISCVFGTAVCIKTGKKSIERGTLQVPIDNVTSVADRALAVVTVTSRLPANSVICCDASTITALDNNQQDVRQNALYTVDISSDGTMVVKLAAVVECGIYILTENIKRAETSPV